MPRKKMPKVYYFLAEEKNICLWDFHLNVIVALATKEGVFAVTNEMCRDLLRHPGYREVSKRKLSALKLEAPEPDRVDHEITPHL